MSSGDCHPRALAVDDSHPWKGHGQVMWNIWYILDPNHVSGIAEASRQILYR